MKPFLFALALFLSVATPVLAQTLAAGTGQGSELNNETKAQIDAANAQIQQLRNEIAALEKDLNSTTAQKQTLQNAIKALDLQIQKLQKSVTLTATQISQKDNEIGTLSGNIRTTQQKIADAQGAIATSLRRLQEADQEQPAIALLGGGTLSSFFDETVNLGSLRDNLQNRVEDLGSLKNNLESNKTTAEQKRQQLATLKTNLDQQKKGVNAAKADQSALLMATKNKESTYQTLIAQKKAEEASFESALIKLAAGLGPADTGSAPSPEKGILSWPLSSVSVTQYFGNTSFAQSGAYSGNGHNGMDFRAPAGTVVRSALDGVVQEVNQGAVKNCQYGKWVLVRHPNGLSTLYAHLSVISVTKGESVNTGDLLGYSGDTGYATGPHLHFTVYIASAVTFKQYTCNSGATAYIPIVPLNAYLNPLSYLPGL